MGSSPVVPTRDPQWPPVVRSPLPCTTSVPSVRKLCERPGCSAMAEVSYGMDHAALLVWIDDNARSERELAGRLCRRHADALVVPRGWTIDDRRDPIPRLFRSIAQDITAGTARSRRQSEPRDRNPRADSPSLFESDGPSEGQDESVDGVVLPATENGLVDAAPAQEEPPNDAAPEPEDRPIDVVPELEYEPIDEMPPDLDDPVIEDAFIDDSGPDNARVDDESADEDEVSDPDATQAMPWTPQLTGRYSPDETGPVSGRLLGRAFGVRRDNE